MENNNQKLTVWHSDGPTRSRPKKSYRPQRAERLKNGYFRVNNNKYVGASNRTSEEKAATTLAIASKKLRIIPLGGLEEVGKNITVFEYGKDILVVDCGFMFPEDDMPGIDYVIPDVSYLQENRERIVGVVITHGHMDHIGALPYILEKLGHPTIYTTRLTAGLIEKRAEEFGPEAKTKVVVFNPDKDKLKLGAFEVEAFRVNHNIPDGMGLIIHTPVGAVVHSGDFKFDYTPINEPVIDVGKLSRIGDRGVLVLLSDSTNSRRPGYSISEREIERNLLQIFSEAKGRIFVACFSSLISRIQEIIDITRQLNRKLVLVGRSIINNFEVALELGYVKVPEGLVVKPEEAHRFPDEKLVILSTGTQGEASSALTRMSRGEHRSFKIKKGDTVVLSSSIIPGNERAVGHVYDNLVKEGGRVINYQLIDIHTGGHAQAEELKMMLKLIRPKYFIPIHGPRYFLQGHAELAIELGLPEDQIFVASNGQVFEFDEEKRGKTIDKRVPSSFVMVDGLGIGDVGNIVLRDRQAMATDGIFVCILTVDHNTSQIVTSPDIISRGFVYMRAAEDLIHRARREVKNIFRRHQAKKPADWAYIKTMIREEMGGFLYRETQRRPMVIPVIIEV